mmetsp:Transcript_47247/g.137499  ORF Transcript_47247/g.137499 Transcript_47247/m.137499 type:complete len:290 (+) Transcript_47247:105-974(+)
MLDRERLLSSDDSEAGGSETDSTLEIEGGVRKVDRRQPRRGWWCGVVCAAALLLSGVASLVVADQWRRQASALNAVLANIERSGLCHQPDSPFCSLRLPSRAKRDFDLGAPRESRMLGFLWAQAAARDRDTMSEILRGAHMWMPVNSTLPEEAAGEGIYEWIKTTPGAWERFSSHFSSEDQYQVLEGSYLCCILTGVINERTWLQFEGAPFRAGSLANMARSVAHCLDYFLYKLYFRPGVGGRLLGPTINVGPLGWSKFTEARPLVFDTVRTVGEACPLVCSEALALTV